MTYFVDIDLSTIILLGLFLRDFSLKIKTLLLVKNKFTICDLELKKGV